MNIDCYARVNNSYHLVSNIDTVLTSRGWLPNEASSILAEAFSTSVSYADSIFINVHSTGPEITEEQFQNLIFSRYQYPILKAAKLSAGIFHNYEDFLNNKPHPVEFEVYYEKNKRHLKSTTIVDSVINESWGFSDGKDLFINVDGSFYKLIRSENTFDLMGPRIVEYKTSIFNKVMLSAASYRLTAPLLDPTPFIEPGQRTVETFKLYQLNISDGIFR